MTQYKYGWKRQLPDQRDFTFKVMGGIPLPTKRDLSPSMPPVYDQGNIGSCTAQAIAGALQYLQVKDNMKWRFTPSRLFIYFNERKMEGTILFDSGAYIRDGIKSVAADGVCPEDSNKTWSWPYWTWMYQVPPPPPCYANAKSHKSILYEAVPQSEYSIKYAIAMGFPVVFGIMVYSSFESAHVTKTGEVPLPSKDESPLGGHAILLTGYDDATQRFTFRNSWGTSWGHKGYGTLPYSYVVNPNLASDFWIIKSTK